MQLSRPVSAVIIHIGSAIDVYRAVAVLV